MSRKKCWSVSMVRLPTNVKPQSDDRSTTDSSSKAAPWHAPTRAWSVAPHCPCFCLAADYGVAEESTVGVGAEFGSEDWDGDDIVGSENGSVTVSNVRSNADQGVLTTIQICKRLPSQGTAGDLTAGVPYVQLRKGGDDEIIVAGPGNGAWGPDVKGVVVSLP
ncbi:hypothetical protein QBC40DRAFT_293665 [Triangularia verruculosa]|uniref:Uncharacterized protein n=1 Tax=Triangularia verruculosa TaxID=2587418 RepID=A0AAN7AYV0_9PEZI|nr:hypothetical protein QBC40DRAFT_293665 [Triangularia verruculosa]